MLLLITMNSGKILVVEDETKIADIVRAYLVKEGYAVEAIEDGIAMDKYLAENDVDLIIMDLMLPCEDGLSIRRRLQQQKNISHLLR